MRWISVPCLVAVLAWLGIYNGSRADDVHEADVVSLMQVLQARVPHGWTVSYEKDNHAIDVTRDAPTLVDFTVPSMSAGEPGNYEKFQFWLWVRPLVSAQDFKRLSLENERTNKKIEGAYARLCASPTVQGIQRPNGPVVKPSEPYSSNPDDESLLAEYAQLKKSLHDLPDGYRGKVSVSWDSASEMGSYGPCPRDPEVRRECEAVIAKLKGTFAKY